MSTTWDVEALAKLSDLQRHQLWLNAKRLGRENVVSMIEASGLPYTDPSGLKLDSPLGRGMFKIVNSAKAKAAAIEATQNGLPALAGVDPLLKSQLGIEYTESYEATIQAGYLVAKMMRNAGYEHAGTQSSHVSR
jgi:hypothetical protein